MEPSSACSDRLSFGKLVYGCKHYRRRCMIRAPCCNELYHCRHCHNDLSDCHDLRRSDVKHVICAVCDTEQPVAQVCTNCGVSMGEYFCEVCKFFDDDKSKGQFHCDECGICRVGGRENFFHCQKCGTCYSLDLRNKHSCVENSMRHDCPICYEYLFDSLKETRVLKCGHTMHAECLYEMLKHDQYSCPICSKSIIDMSKIWRKYDEELADFFVKSHHRNYNFLFATLFAAHEFDTPCVGVSFINIFPQTKRWHAVGDMMHIRSFTCIEEILMPEDYRHKKVWILCNDCNDITEAVFHVIGQKCLHCLSYNTRSIAPPVLP